MSGIYGDIVNEAVIKGHFLTSEGKRLKDNISSELSKISKESLEAYNKERKDSSVIDKGRDEIRGQRFKPNQKLISEIYKVLKKYLNPVQISKLVEKEANVAVHGVAVNAKQYFIYCCGFYKNRIYNISICIIGSKCKIVMFDEVRFSLIPSGFIKTCMQSLANIAYINVKKKSIVIKQYHDVASAKTNQTVNKIIQSEQRKYPDKKIKYNDTLQIINI